MNPNFQIPDIRPIDDDRLSAKEITEIVNELLKRDDPTHRRYDPVDDFSTLASFAIFGVPGSREIPGPWVKTPNLPAMEGRTRGWQLVVYVGHYLYALNPTLSALEWTRIYHGLLRARYGSSRVRIRKRQALAAKMDAKRLSFKQMRTKYPHLSRSRIYKLLADAHRKK